MSILGTPAEPLVRIGVGWAGSFVMTRSFARWLPGDPAIGLLADMMNRLDLIASGDLDITWAFPMARVRWAYLGGRTWPDSPWAGPPLSNVRLLARIPRRDHELIGVAPWSPIQSLKELTEHRPLRVCFRTDQFYEFESAIFQQYGYSIADIERDGGRHWHIATGAHEIATELANQTVDMMIGHAAYSGPWKAAAVAGFRFLPLDEDVVQSLEAVGFDRKVVLPGVNQGVNEPLLTLDLSDQPIVCRAEVPDDVIYEIAKSIDLHKKAMTDSAGGQTDPIERQWETRVVPLHPGAERYYLEAGYL